MNSGATVAPRSLGKPAARFPAAIAGDSDLMIATDRQVTHLAATLDAASTAMSIRDPAMVGANQLLSIDSEIVKTLAAPSGSTVSIQRGFDGTTPAVHLAGAAVSGFIDAWHHNALVSEIEAIENALGANLSRIPAAAFLISTAYAFPAQSPGGALVAGNNSITLSPVPAGVNGTDQSHYLYISGGTGTAEPVLITGGTAVSGAASGTVIVNCANAHSGTWSIRTATAGIQEAVVTLGSAGGTIIVPRATHEMYGPVTVSGSSVCITGDQGAVVNDNTPAGMNLFRFAQGSTVGGRNAIKGLYIFCPKSTATDSVIYIDGQNTMLVRDVYIQGGTPTGITIAANPNTFDVYIEDVNVSLNSQSAGTGIAVIGNGSLKPSGIYLTHVQLASGQNGLYLSGVGGLYVAQCDLISQNTGIMIAPGNGAQVALCWFTDVTVDTAAGNGIQISPTGTGEVTGLDFTRCWAATHSGVGIQINGTASTVNGIRFIGLRAVNNRNTGIQFNGGKNLHLIDCVVAGNGNASPGALYGLEVAAGISDFQIIGGIFGPSDSFPDTQAFGILIRAGASDRYQITNAVLRGNTVAGLNDQGTGLAKIIRDNPGLDDVAWPTFASAASINLGTTPQPMYYISGTTPITTIQGGWRGRAIALNFTAAAPGGVATGGNIARAQTAAQNQPIRLTFDGSNWW